MATHYRPPTKLEIQRLYYTAMGLSRKEIIAKERKNHGNEIWIGAIKASRVNILKKLGVTTTAEAIAEAMKRCIGECDIPMIEIRWPIHINNPPSENQQEVLELYAQWFLIKEISHILNISESAVKQRLQLAAENLNAKNTNEAVTRYLHFKWTPTL